MWHGNCYKWHGKDGSYFYPSRDPVLFQKIASPLAALLHKTLFLKFHSYFGIFYSVYLLLTREQVVGISTHLILLYLVFELNKNPS